MKKKVDPFSRVKLKLKHCVTQCIDTHLNAAHQQTAQTSAFTEVLTLVDHQLIKCT